MVESKRIYEEALKSLPNPDPMEEYKDCPPLQEHLVHKTFLEELVFWTVKFEFPQKVVCLLLNMLPDPDYKVKKCTFNCFFFVRIVLLRIKNQLIQNVNIVSKVLCQDQNDTGVFSLIYLNFKY